MAWLMAFLLTIAIETPFVHVLLRNHEPRASRRVILAVFASLATHPVVWFAFPALPLAPWPRFWTSELWAVVVEALLYAVAVRGLSWARAGTVSLAANGASALFGVVLAGTRWGKLLG